AFLENNPRTQTLARINWRGENTMFHFRTGNVRYVLGSSLQTAGDAQISSSTATDAFLDGLARSLKAYDFLAAGALFVVVLGQIFSKGRRHLIFPFALFSCIALGKNQCGSDNGACVLGFALGLFAVALTVY